MAEIVNKIAAVRQAWITDHDYRQPSALYLGASEYLQLLENINPYNTLTPPPVATYMGMRLYVLRDVHHLNVTTIQTNASA